MSLQSTCLARLGSRYSIIFDPVRREIHYGSLGLMCQNRARLEVRLTARNGRTAGLPFAGHEHGFTILEQRQSMTSLVFTGHSLELGLAFEATLTAPFWPQDVRTSTFPGYIIRFKLSRINRVRWERVAAGVVRKGTLRLGISFDGLTCRVGRDSLALAYPVQTGSRHKTGEGGQENVLEHTPLTRSVPTTGNATDAIVPLAGAWRIRARHVELAYDLDTNAVQESAVGLVSYCADAFFERFGKPMAFKYTALWKNIAETSAYARRNWRKLVAKSAAFDRVWTESSVPYAARNLGALSFQSYLMNTLWTVGRAPREWFSVWEGSCWYNSTVDVTYNEALFYFSCWPQLLEMIFEEWSLHANDNAADIRRRKIVSDDDKFGGDSGVFDFPGRILQHDMGAGWTANGMSYHHMMPVEENSNWLLLLYAHGTWWRKPELFRRYAQLNRDLVDYLVWTDSTGNGFPDRGTANTIDDATPAVQYGRDNVYLGIKRLAALHAARRMFEQIGDAAYARTCAAVVRKAVAFLNRGWLGDHWGVCLDKSARGLVDCWTKKPLPYAVLPGWDACSLYTTNGLLYLMMVDDLPEGLDRQRLRQDVRTAAERSMTEYGCGHSSLDKQNMWVSMNVWRDCAAAYLGEDMLANCERYWQQQVFANGLGSEKPNCFTETSLTNNLVWYPRNAAIFGLPWSIARLRIPARGRKRQPQIDPVVAGRWPLLPLADWKRGTVPYAEGPAKPPRTKRSSRNS